MTDQKPSPPYKEIRVNEHLTLRMLKADEAQELFEVTERNREYLEPWMPWMKNNKTAKDSEKFIKSILKAGGRDFPYGYGMIYDGRLAGHTSLMHLPGEKYPEIGYWLDHELNGKGLTTKAVIALKRFGFDSLGLNKIILKAMPENIASNRVAEKAGFKLEVTKEYPGRGTMNVWSVTE